MSCKFGESNQNKPNNLFRYRKSANDKLDPF